MATYVTDTMPSGSPDTWQPFVVRMRIDFSKLDAAGTAFANADVLRGPELEEGVMPIRMWSSVITAGNADTGNVTIGYTGSAAAWMSAATLDVNGTAGTVTELTLAGDVAVPAQTDSTRQYMLVTAAAAQTVTSGVIEILMLCVKTGGALL